MLIDSDREIRMDLTDHLTALVEAWLFGYVVGFLSAALVVILAEGTGW